MSSDDTPVADGGSQRPEPHHLDRYESRVTEVGGIAVRRALPKRERRTIGAWCFVDHFGPTAPGVSMNIGPHPHIGLQTVTWLVAGEVLHRDGLGSEQVIRPGQLNLMTAGRGIAHAEESPAGRDLLQHGAQLWVALPEATRHGAPAFEHHAELPRASFGGVEATVLVGDLDGHASPARRDTPLVGAALTAVDQRESTIPLVPAFEYGVVVLDGELRVDAAPLRPGELAYLGPDRSELSVTATPGCHALLLGGEPFETPILMWWNFVARTRDEIREAAGAWNDARDPFAPVASPLPRIPAPAPI